ncbi:MAG TPA: hypothetical protein VGN19_12915 [Pedococcus sp.]|nr:hypothetical protein [Pedococcus sp.]
MPHNREGLAAATLDARAHPNSGLDRRSGRPHPALHAQVIAAELYGRDYHVPVEF